MEQRWVELWNRIGAHGDPRPWFNDLVARYGEPHRRHHGLAHIEQCLDLLDECPTLVRSPDAVRFALWYHDVIYDPRRDDNEEQSTAYAVQVTIEVGLPEAFSRTVADLILATKHSDEIPTDPDAQLIIDVDLSVLGQPESVFDEYEQRIKKEYDWVPEQVFRSARATILRSFLERPTIYSTSYFRSRYEIQARRNVTKSLGLLESTRTP